MKPRHFAIVIDDDPSVRRALRRLLRAGGMDVDTCESAEAFLAAVFPREPDCLVLDVRMPSMSGPELRALLISQGRAIPVVYITAHVEAEDGGLSELGAVEVLRKPFEAQMLLDAIVRAAGRRRSPHRTKGQ